MPSGLSRRGAAVEALEADGVLAATRPEVGEQLRALGRAALSPSRSGGRIRTTRPPSIASSAHPVQLVHRRRQWRRRSTGRRVRAADDEPVVARRQRQPAASPSGSDQQRERRSCRRRSRASTAQRGPISRRRRPARSNVHVQVIAAECAHRRPRGRPAPDRLRPRRPRPVRAGSRPSTRSVAPAVEMVEVLVAQPRRVRRGPRGRRPAPRRSWPSACGPRRDVAAAAERA